MAGWRETTMAAVTQKESEQELADVQAGCLCATKTLTTQLKSMKQDFIAC